MEWLKITSMQSYTNRIVKGTEMFPILSIDCGKERPKETKKMKDSEN